MASSSQRIFEKKCSNPECKQEFEANKKCSFCKEVYFCNYHCQEIGWKTHRVVCGYPNSKSKNPVLLQLYEEKCKALKCFELIIDKIFKKPEANWWWHSMSKLYYTEVLKSEEKKKKEKEKESEKTKSDKEEDEAEEIDVEIKYDMKIDNPKLSAKGILTFDIENIEAAQQLALTDIFDLKFQGYCIRSVYLKYSTDLNLNIQEKLKKYDPSNSFCVVLTMPVAENYDAQVTAVIPRIADPEKQIKKSLIKVATPDETETLKGRALREKHLENLENALKKRGIMPSYVEGVFREMYSTYVENNQVFVTPIGHNDFTMIMSCIPTSTKKGEKGEDEDEFQPGPSQSASNPNPEKE